jgi:hypothetical protein
LRAQVLFAAIFLSASLASAQPTDLLPDMLVVRDVLSETRLDRTTLPGRTLLRLSTGTANNGSGQLELRAGAVISATQRQVHQRIYRSDGTFSSRLAGTFTYHPTHAHTHFDDWVVVRLREIVGDAGVGGVVVEGSKRSFCLFDGFVYDEANPFINSPPHYVTCTSTVQGQTPGWGDVYDLELPDQWIDITGVPDGFYWLEAQVDPENLVVEEDDDNNTERIRVWIGAPPPSRPDPYEENDSIEQVEVRPEGEPDSPNLGLVNAKRVIEGLSMEDALDYFRFRMNNTGGAGDYIRIESEYLLNNDIELLLFDANGTFLDFSSLLGALEQVSLDGVPAGDYVILVARFRGNNPEYRLIIDPAANNPPGIEVLRPSAGDMLVEQAFETLPVEWIASDSDGDPTHVSLLIDRDGQLGKDTLPVLGYQDLPGSSGLANVNTAGIAIGTWYLHAFVTDGGALAGVWAPGTFTVYEKGDVDFSGTVDRCDWLAVVRLFPHRLPPDWAVIADMDRNDKLDVRDLLLLGRAVLDRRSGHGPTGPPGPWCRLPR